MSKKDRKVDMTITNYDISSFAQPLIFSIFSLTNLPKNSFNILLVLGIDVLDFDTKELKPWENILVT